MGALSGEFFSTSPVAKELSCELFVNREVSEEGYYCKSDFVEIIELSAADRGISVRFNLPMHPIIETLRLSSLRPSNNASLPAAEYLIEKCFLPFENLLPRIEDIILLYSSLHLFLLCVSVEPGLIFECLSWHLLGELLLKFEELDGDLEQTRTQQLID